MPSDRVDISPYEPTANADRSVAYFVSVEYRVQKIRGRDGRVIWQSQAAGLPSAFRAGGSMVASGGNVIVGNVDLFAFDTTNGRPAWSYTAPDLDETGYSAIVADDSTVFSAGRTARVYAIDAHGGHARWILDLREGEGSAIGALNPTLFDGILYVCTRRVMNPLTGTIWAIDASTGVVRWRHRFAPELPQQGSRCFGHATVWKDLVIQPQEDGRVFAFDRATGGVRWIAPRAHDVNVSAGDIPYAAAGATAVLVTSQAGRGGIYAYDPATGREIWRREDIGGSLHPPAIDGDVAYVDHGWIYASYELSTGRVRWQTPRSWLDPETPYKGRPVIAKDRIYVAGRDGSYALRR